MTLRAWVAVGLLWAPVVTVRQILNTDHYKASGLSTLPQELLQEINDMVVLRALHICDKELETRLVGMATLKPSPEEWVSFVSEIADKFREVANGKDYITLLEYSTKMETRTSKIANYMRDIFGYWANKAEPKGQMTMPEFVTFVLTNGEPGECMYRKYAKEMPEKAKSRWPTFAEEQQLVSAAEADAEKVA